MNIPGLHQKDGSKLKAAFPTGGLLGLVRYLCPGSETAQN